MWELYNLAVEARGVDIGPMIVRQRAIQSLKWKVIEPTAGDPAVYDLYGDPNELSPMKATNHVEGQLLLSLLDQR